jgi:FtsP/CotA-like multicopper oxidase with cupredoxin domain
MSGGMIVNGILDPFPPELRSAKEQILLLKDIAIEDGKVPDDIDPSDPGIRTVNGLLSPTIEIQPGETQFWRIGNIGADKYYKLVLDGHTFYEIATDGNRHNRVVTKQVNLIPPSSRSEVFIQGGAPGTYKLRALAFETGPQGDSYPEVTMATLVVKGPAVEPFPIPRDLPPVEDLRNLPIDVHRTVVFSETPDGDTFFVNGQEFGMNRIDTIVKLGSLEEWTIRNISGELHVFHIHQLDFQVTQINGVNQPFIGYQDTINVPVHGRVKVLIPFTNPVIVGKFVYHCHILEHEDKGMMAVIQVRDPANPQLGMDSPLKGINMPAVHNHH